MAPLVCSKGNDHDDGLFVDDEGAAAYHSGGDIVANNKDTAVAKNNDTVTSNVIHSDEAGTVESTVAANKTDTPKTSAIVTCIMGYVFCH